MRAYIVPTAVAGRERERGGKARVIGGGCVGAAGRLWRSESGPEGYFFKFRPHFHGFFRQFL